MRRATVLVAILVAVTAMLAGQARATDASPSSTQQLQSLDQAILEQLNQVRAAHGLKPLVLSRDLGRAALYQSRAMLSGGFFSHDAPDGTTFSSRIKRFYSSAGYGLWSAGENLLYDSGDLDAAGAVQAWMNSPPHRRNMLDPNWREVGIAAVYAPSAGGLYGGDAATVITMDFGVRQRSMTTKRIAPAKPRLKPAA